MGILSRIILIVILANTLLFSCREAEQKKAGSTLQWQPSFSEFIVKKQNYTNAIDSIIALLQDPELDNSVKLEAAADLATRFNCNSSKQFEEELLYQAKQLNSKKSMNLALLLRQRCLSEEMCIRDSISAWAITIQFYQR